MWYAVDAELPALSNYPTLDPIAPPVFNIWHFEENDRLCGSGKTEFIPPSQNHTDWNLFLDSAPGLKYSLGEQWALARKKRPVRAEEHGYTEICIILTQLANVCTRWVEQFRVGHPFSRFTSPCCLPPSHRPPAKQKCFDQYEQNVLDTIPSL